MPDVYSFARGGLAWLLITCLLTACSQKASVPTEAATPTPDASAPETSESAPTDAGPRAAIDASRCSAPALQPTFCVPDSPTELDHTAVQAWFAQRDVTFEPILLTETFSSCRELAGDDPSLHCENTVYLVDPIRKETNFAAGVDLVVLGVRNGRMLERLRVPITVGDGLLFASHVTVEADAVHIEADAAGCTQARPALTAFWKERWKRLDEELASEAAWGRREITTIRKRQERTDHARLEAMCRSAGTYRPARGGIWTR